MPRNDAGKVLRSALPRWVGFKASAFDAEAHEDGRAPPTALEAALAGIWAHALGVARVERDHRYFDDPVHAPRGADLLAQVQAVFGIALAPGVLAGEAGTVEGMARVVARLRGTPAA